MRNQFWSLRFHRWLMIPLVIAVGVWVYERYAPQMSAMKFVRNTRVISDTPPTVSFPRTVIDARVTKITLPVFLSGKRRPDDRRFLFMDIVLEEFIPSESETIFSLRRAWKVWRGVPIARIAVVGRIAVRSEDLRGAQALLQERNLNRVAFDRLPMARDTRLVAMRMWRGTPLRVRAMPRETVVAWRTQGNRGALDVEVWCDVLSAEELPVSTISY